MVFGVIEVALWRAFPGSGQYPFSWQELLAALVFCFLGLAMSWGVERAGPLWWMFVVYLVAVLAAFAIPSAVGENVLRIRYAAIPLAVLTLSLRRWRPLPIALGARARRHLERDAAALRLPPRPQRPRHAPCLLDPAIGFLRGHLSPSYRVEVVDTTGHWAAAYLAEAHIPIARGGYRQDNFPQNELLYDDPLGLERPTGPGCAGSASATSC